MASAPVEPRVSALESAMAELARAQARTQAQLDQLAHNVDRTQAHVDQLAREMRTFKDEMGAFKDEMRAFAERSDKQLGELSNRMGRLVEDIVAPSIPQVFKTLFGETQEPELAVRVRRRHRTDSGRMAEYDAVASAGGVFLVNETKSEIDPSDVRHFLKSLAEVRSFLPVPEGQKVVGSLASFYVDPSVVRAGERRGLVMLGLSRGIVEILNRPGFKPRAF